MDGKPISILRLRALLHRVAGLLATLVRSTRCLLLRDSLTLFVWQRYLRAFRRPMARHLILISGPALPPLLLFPLRPYVVERRRVLILSIINGPILLRRSLRLALRAALMTSTRRSYSRTVARDQTERLHRVGITLISVLLRELRLRRLGG